MVKGLDSRGWLGDGPRKSTHKLLWFPVSDLCPLPYLCTCVYFMHLFVLFAIYLHTPFR